MSPIAVSSGVPVPKPIGHARSSKYPFATMEVGEFFFLPGKTTETFATYASLQGRRLDRKFQTRTVFMIQDKKTKAWKMAEENDAGARKGVGVWRLD